MIDGDKCTIIILYVDDLMIIGRHVEKTKDIDIQLSTKFKMSNLGTMQQYIGLAFLYLSTRIFLLQNKYANKLLRRFRMVNNNPISTLMEERLQLQSNMGEEFVDQLMYKSMVRSLIFLTHSRPYISFVVSCVNWYLGAPQQTHFITIKKIYDTSREHVMEYSILMHVQHN
jgi:hypothetical protein